jgi:hypothetical protein
MKHTIKKEIVLTRIVLRPSIRLRVEIVSIAILENTRLKRDLSKVSDVRMSNVVNMNIMGIMASVNTINAILNSNF